MLPLIVSAVMFRPHGVLDTLGYVLLATRAIAVLYIVHMRELHYCLIGPSVHSPAVELLLTQINLPIPFRVLHIARWTRVTRFVFGQFSLSCSESQIAADNKLDVDMVFIYVEATVLNLLQHGGQLRHKLFQFLEAIVAKIESDG
jgi:hypothetical protein